MSLQRGLEKIRYIDQLIVKRATGPQQDLARKARLSISGLNNYLSEMRELGFPIRFCRKKKTYYYTDNGRMVDLLYETTMSREEFK